MDDVSPTVGEPAIKSISDSLAAISLDGGSTQDRGSEVTSETDAQGHDSDHSVHCPPNASDEKELEPLNVVHQKESKPDGPSPTSSGQSSPDVQSPLYDDPAESDDGEGEWITPSNVALHKSRALELLPHAGVKNKGKVDEVINTGCMTADFAMQNVLLQMGLNLVSVEGKRIEKLKTWVLRCHACFKCVCLLMC